MLPRRTAQLAAALLGTVTVFAGLSWPAAASPAGAGRPAARRATTTVSTGARGGHAGCAESAAQRAHHKWTIYRAEETFAGTRRHPLMVVLGGSFTAGVGASRPASAWPYLLGRLLGWRVLAVGVPGAGYVASGEAHAGPIRKELGDVRLGQDHPALVIIQAGHNDLDARPAVLRRAVDRTVSAVHRAWPHATLAALTVFPRGPVSARARGTNRLIVTSLRAADRSVVVLDPINGHWRFPTVSDHLHPTPAGHQWIAQRVAASLVAHGIAPARPAVRPVVRADPLDPRHVASRRRRGGTGAAARTGSSPREPAGAPTAAQRCRPHSVLTEPAQRPERASAPGATGSVVGAQPIEG